MEIPFDTVVFKSTPQPAGPLLVEPPASGCVLKPLLGTKRSNVQLAANGPKRPRFKTRPRNPRQGHNGIVPFPMDIWAIILRFTDPKTMLQARLICRDVRELLQYESVWADFRLNYFGNDTPPPPDGLNEFQYIDLLASYGCMCCGKKNVRKVYWAFLRRWCKGCFATKTIKVLILPLCRRTDR